MSNTKGSPTVFGVLMSGYPPSPQPGKGPKSSKLSSRTKKRGR